MSPEYVDRTVESVNEFNRHEGRQDGVRVVAALASGLTILRDLFVERSHADVERLVGKDSTLIPLSVLKAQRQMHFEVSLYETVESAWAARQFGCTRSQDDWYLHWLANLRLGATWSDELTLRRLHEYFDQTPDARRLALMDALLAILRESSRVPLVLYRLFPLAIHLATALAFGDFERAKEIRRQQGICLPAISDCHHCRGGVFENGEVCRWCGNPLWTYEWLNVTD